MKKLIQLTVFLFFISAFSTSCNKCNMPEDGAIAATLYDYTGLDGCSWIIKLENDEVLEPLNLQDFGIELQEGKNIWVKYSVSTNTASICMVGSMITIEGIWDR